MRISLKLTIIALMMLILPLRLLAASPLAQGNIAGFVFNYYGLAISGATVGIQGGPVTVSAADGYFLLEGVSIGGQTVGCGKAGYNTVWVPVNVIPEDTVLQNFTLTQPVMMINPLSIAETINPGEYYSTTVNVLNNGTGILNWQASVNLISSPVFPCMYSIALFDTWGDGWNGCSIDVLVNDSVVLDNITLNSGSGPGYFYFSVNSGDQITTDFNPGPFISEPYYYLYNADNEQVWFSPAGNSGPPDILPGQLTAACVGDAWLTMDYYEGEVDPFGDVDNVPVHLNATGMNTGDNYEAEIVFYSDPDVGEITIPVSVSIMGDEIFPPENLDAELIDAVNGKVKLTWNWSGEAFQFFAIKRDGIIIATTTSQTYTDILPGHGYFCYTVQAFYNEGNTEPAGPECAEWPDPVLNVNPADLEGWVWSGFTMDVFTTIRNQGEGTLYYSFPEFAALDLLRDPGQPVVLGAGGPDAFGYVWIDSDEPGGPVFNYSDISATGIPVFGLSDDNITGPFNIGFDFHYYGQVKTQFWINSNGCISFNSNYVTNQNTAIPTNHSVYNDFIAWMWDDLVFKPGTSQVFYQQFPDRLIIQFKNYEQFGHPGVAINTEVIIYKNGKILILYDDIGQGINTGICTVGLQSSAPSTGLQVVFNSAYLHNDLAIFMRVPGDFIVDVAPAFGTVLENDSAVITFTYDSKDYLPGPYTEELILESNDLDHPEFSIDNTMNVYSPAIFAGYVYDQDNDEPLNGVKVTAGPYQASTGEDGEYILYVDEGSYNVVFEKLGYIPVTIDDTLALKELITPIDAGLWDMNYPPSFVQAEMMGDYHTCLIYWGLPEGPYEIIMDDGEADDFFVYAHAGSWNAVKFTPSGYPATVIGGGFYVGDGTFPGPFLGTDFGVAVFDDDGVNGMPGTMLDSNGITVNNSGWVNMDWLHAVINEGSFYLAMYQSQNVPHAAPIGVDSDNPTNFRSYSKFQSGNWSLSPLQDFMIRAWVNGPEGNTVIASAGNEHKIYRATPGIPDNWQNWAQTASGTIPPALKGCERNDATVKRIADLNSRNVAIYRLVRYSAFDPNLPIDPPQNGTLTEIASTEDLSYIDYYYYGVTGWYAYGVKALYTNGEFSDYTISNIIGSNMDCQATFNISLTTGEEAEDVKITLQGLDYPYETFFEVTSAEGTAVFEEIWKGHYYIKIDKIGYDIYEIEDVYFSDDRVFNIILSEKKYPPTCLTVDPVTLIATWCYPRITALEEDFEDPGFPPEGWQSTAGCDTTAWFRTDNGSYSGWVIPPWDSYYALYLDGYGGSDCDGCCEYLVTPPVDLRESQDYMFSFDSYYDGLYGQLAFIEYSFDQGKTWEVLYQLMPAIDWTLLEVDLGGFGGSEQPEQMWFAFHADNGGDLASGWAIDNVRLNVPAPPALFEDFYVFLDDIYIGQTETTSWNFAPLEYGHTYTVSVAAKYSSGLSQKDYCTFECKYLFPPQNLVGNAPDDAAILTWDPPGPGVPFNLYGYNVYRNDLFLGYLPHFGEWEPQQFIELDLEPGIYSYEVTGIYDLSPYGFPGETGESMAEGPEQVVVDYCTELEFIETWDLGSIEENNWKSGGPNWVVSNNTGNPPPVVKFNWSPIQVDYEIPLESYPLCAVGLTEGTIWLDFDLALSSIDSTGQEFLSVEVWNWDEQQWHAVTIFSNSVGNFGWTSHHLDIGAIALDNIFKVRFIAKGKNSLDIRAWFIDNIHLYRTCAAPDNLAIDPDFYDGIKLTFIFPENGKSDLGNGNRELTGHNVFRSINGADYELLTQTPGSLPYIDPDTNLVMGSMYCYQVTAVYNSETDQCESGLSNEVCAIWTGTGEVDFAHGNSPVIYPNPATDHVSIQSSEEIEIVTVLNTLGLIILDKKTNSRHVELNTSAYPPGTYLIRIETERGATARALTIHR